MARLEAPDPSELARLRESRHLAEAAPGTANTAEPLYDVSELPAAATHGGQPLGRSHPFVRSFRRLLFGGLSTGVVSPGAQALNPTGSGVNPAFNATACYCQLRDAAFG